MTFAREPLQMVEIVQPKCSRTFGVAPCNATGTPCYNTDATCKFLAALDLTDSINLQFVKPAANRFLDGSSSLAGTSLLTQSNQLLWTQTDDEIEVEGSQPTVPLFQPSTAIPALMAVSTAPTVLNVAAGSQDMSPLGLRAVAQVGIKDFPSNDVETDPYVTGRGYDPATRGSFWSKWLARNPYHTGFILRIYDGYFGDTLSQMIKREYFIEKIDASRSSVAITAKDVLRKVTDNRVSAPFLSNGALTLNLAIDGTSFQVAGALLADYPATGWVRIGSEVIAYTSRADVGGNIEFTGLTRAALATTASTHNQNARVQRVLAYENVPFQDIIYDLLTVWGGIPTAYIDKAAWDAEKAEWRQIYDFTAYLTDPEEVDKLCGEILQQAQSNIWWDERVQQIILRAQRPNFLPQTISQEGEIIADSFSIKEVAKERASQVYVYYGLRNPTLSVTDKFSYGQGEVFIDVDKERQYGEPAVREIFCRWITTSVLAASLAGSYLQRFRDVRRHITFQLTAKDIANFWTGDVANVRHFMYVDFDGNERIDQWLITSAETVEQGGVYAFEAEDNGSAGLLWEWVADDDTRPSTQIGAWVDANGEDGSGNVLPFAWL